MIYTRPWYNQSDIFSMIAAAPLFPALQHYFNHGIHTCWWQITAFPSWGSQNLTCKLIFDRWILFGQVWHIFHGETRNAHTLTHIPTSYTQDAVIGNEGLHQGILGKVLYKIVPPEWPDTAENIYFLSERHCSSTSSRFPECHIRHANHLRPQAPHLTRVQFY